MLLFNSKNIIKNLSSDDMMKCEAFHICSYIWHMKVKCIFDNQKVRCKNQGNPNDYLCDVCIHDVCISYVEKLQLPREKFHGHMKDELLGISVRHIKQESI